MVRFSHAPGPEPLTVGECHIHFKKTLARSKWSVVKGLHTLRHSVASCLAAAGVDQRIIDDMLGHVTEEMRRRYRHPDSCREETGGHDGVWVNDGVGKQHQEWSFAA